MYKSPKSDALIIETDFLLRRMAEVAIGYKNDFNSLQKFENVGDTDPATAEEQPSTDGNDVKMTGLVNSMVIFKDQGCVMANDKNCILLAGKEYKKCLTSPFIKSIKDLTTGEFLNFNAVGNAVMLYGSGSRNETWFIGDDGYPKSHVAEVEHFGSKINMLHNYEYEFEGKSDLLPTRVSITKIDLENEQIVEIERKRYLYTEDPDNDTIRYATANTVGDEFTTPIFEIKLV